MTQIVLTTTGAWFALTFILLPIFLYVFVSALYRSNRRYFEAFQIAPIVQEMLRTCDPQNAFLALNLRSIIFNLGQGKWWTGNETCQSGGSWSKELSLPAHVSHFQQRAVPTIWFTHADGKSYEDAQTGRRYEGLVEPLSMCHSPPSFTDCELLIQLNFKSITFLDLVDKENWKAGENGILWTFCKGVNREKSRKVPDVFVLIV